MAGQLTIDTLRASSGVLATQNGMTGIAKAWVTFSSVTSGYTIYGSFNVGSITRNAQGDYTVNFTTAMPDANYAALATGISYATNDTRVVMDLKGSAFNGTPSLKTTTQCAFLYGSTGSTAIYDVGYASCAFLGN